MNDRKKAYLRLAPVALLFVVLCLWAWLKPAGDLSLAERRPLAQMPALSADALLGEITPAMSAAVGRSRAVKLLLPLNQCNTIVVGTRALSVSALIAETLGELEKLTGKS